MKPAFRAAINLASRAELGPMVLMVLIGLSIAATCLALNLLISDARQETRTQETVKLLILLGGLLSLSAGAWAILMVIG